MNEVFSVIAFISALLSLLFIRKKYSEFLVTISVVVTLIPFLSQAKPLEAAACLSLLIIFEVSCFNNEVWNLKKFKSLSKSRSNLIWLAIILTLGLTSITWWLQIIESKMLEMQGRSEGWWKVLLVIALCMHFVNLKTKLRGNQYD